MIDVAKEKLVTFADLARRLPRRRRNRPVHVATIHRWRSKGLRGVRLEAVRVGGAWHTTMEAFARFCERLTRPEIDDQGADSGSSFRQNMPNPFETDQSLDAEGL